MLLFTRLVGAPEINKQRAAYLAQLHRSVNCLIAGRILLTTGFEETCRSVTRNYIESLDVSLACLVDREFSAWFFGDDSIDYEALWKTNIGYGKIYQYIKIACKLAGLSEEEIDEHIELRKHQKTLLSSSVHGDDSGALRSMMPPLLGYPGRLSTEPHGVISFHTANHAAAVISETYKYLSLVLKILTSENTPPEFELPREGAQLHSFFAHFFAFQEIYLRHELPDGEDIIAPDFSTDDEQA